MNNRFSAGKNIAMKVPPHEYEATVAFYRDIVELTELTPADDVSTPRFDFGGKVLWIDRVEGCSQAEIWLKITADNPVEAAEHFERNGIARCDAIEPLPDDFNGFWILSPCNIVHLIAGADAA